MRWLAAPAGAAVVVLGVWVAGRLRHRRFPRLDGPHGTVGPDRRSGVRVARAPSAAHAVFRWLPALWWQ